MTAYQNIDEKPKWLRTMTLDEVREWAPAAFASQRQGDRTTERYQHINTVDVINSLAEKGYAITDARQDRPRSRDPQYVRHVVTMAYAKDISKDAKSDVVPQLMLVNSHNGRTKMRLMTGLYRMICANGLVVGNDLARFEIAHKGEIKSELESGLIQLTEATENAVTCMVDWQAKELKRRQALQLARKALVLRFGDERSKAYDPEKLLEPVRSADEKPSLWNVFNIVQEKLIHRGLEGVNSNNLAVRSRPVGDLNRRLELNRELWSLSEKYAA